MGALLQKLAKSNLVDLYFDDFGGGEGNFRNGPGVRTHASLSSPYSPSTLAANLFSLYPAPCTDWYFVQYVHGVKRKGKERFWHPFFFKDL